MQKNKPFFFFFFFLIYYFLTCCRLEEIVVVEVTQMQMQMQTHFGEKSCRIARTIKYLEPERLANNRLKSNLLTSEDQRNCLPPLEGTS